MPDTRPHPDGCELPEEVQAVHPFTHQTGKAELHRCWKNGVAHYTLVFGGSWDYTTSDGKTAHGTDHLMISHIPADQRDNALRGNYRVQYLPEWGSFNFVSGTRAMQGVQESYMGLLAL